MSDEARWLVEAYGNIRAITGNAGDIQPERNALLAYIEHIERERDGLMRECYEVEQTLGKALGYPWYKDDQNAFHGATENDGVCIGEHVPASIAAETAKRIAELEAENARLRVSLEIWQRAVQINDAAKVETP